MTCKYFTLLILVDYTSDEVPLKVEMDAWSPKIPLDAKNSGIPVIVFNFTVTNKTGHDATVGYSTWLVTFGYFVIFS